MEKVVLHATRRTVIGKQVGALRRQGKLPAVIYGRHLESTPIMLELHATTMALMRLTSSSIITVDVEGTEYAALVREKQRDYIRNVITHLDFQAVSSTEKIRTTVSIELTGIAPAVKDFNAVLVSGLDKVEVESLPQDLPERFVVDISALKNIGDGIYVHDLIVSDEVQIHSDPNEMIAIATAAAAEEVVETLPSAAEPEVIEKGKKEEVEE
jgi:large subunit ribosomal protein L25